MNPKDLKYFKDKLLAEKATLEEELKSVGRINPNNPGDWEATVDDSDIDSADENEVADKIEEYEEHSAILKQLEKQYNEVKKALDRIEKGTFGICEVDNKPIEKGRLEANTSATICAKHMNEIPENNK